MGSVTLAASADIPPPPPFAAAEDETAPRCAGAADDGAACATIADALADLLSTRVCPAVYRQALLQGKSPPPPPLLRARCAGWTPPAEAETPRFLRRIVDAGLGRTLLDLLIARKVARGAA